MKSGTASSRCRKLAARMATIGMFSACGCKASGPTPEAPDDRLRDVVTVVTEWSRSCALDTKHRVYCWGDFDTRERKARSSRPVHISGADGAEAIGLAEQEAYAQLPGRDVMYWPFSSARRHWPSAMLSPRSDVSDPGSPWIAVDSGMRTRGRLFLDPSCKYDAPYLSCDEHEQMGLPRMELGERAAVPDLEALTYVQTERTPDVLEQTPCGKFRGNSVACLRNGQWVPIATPARVEQVATSAGNPLALRLADGGVGVINWDFEFELLPALPPAFSVGTEGSQICIVAGAGEVWCTWWVVRGPGMSPEVPPPARVDGIDDAVAVFPDGFGGGYVLDAGGHLRCWGLNSEGQCGTGPSSISEERIPPTWVVAPIEPAEVAENG